MTEGVRFHDTAEIVLKGMGKIESPGEQSFKLALVLNELFRSGVEYGLSFAIATFDECRYCVDVCRQEESPKLGCVCFMCETKRELEKYQSKPK